MRHFSGDFNGMRLLMEDELDLIAGGDGEDGDETPEVTLPEIIIVGHADHTTHYVPNPFSWLGQSHYDITQSNPEPTDESSIHVDVKITRALTDVEQKALDHFIETIQKTTEAIAAIPDTAHVTLSNGMTLTGAEVKEAWSRLDFIINDDNIRYANGTTQSESDYNSGDPLVSINIHMLTDYDKLSGGLNFLVMHELGHVTPPGRFDLANSTENQMERDANDIAWAIAGYSGQPIATNPGFGYSPNHPSFTN